MSKKQINETPEEKQYRETVETIAGNISKLARAVTALLEEGPLKKKAIVILLANSSGNTQSTVTQVLDAISNLESDWLNPPKK